MTMTPCIGSLFSKDDGSCSIPGCNDPSASNYHAEATFNDGSCAARRRLGVVVGSTVGMENESSTQTQVQVAGASAAAVAVHRHLAVGCMDPSASNYVATATSSSGCEYTILGCTDSNALNFLAIAEAEYSPSDCIHPVSHERWRASRLQRSRRLACWESRVCDRVDVSVRLQVRLQVRV